MFLDAQRPAVFVVVAGKVLLIETQHQLVRIIQPKVALDHVDILIASHLIGPHLWRQQSLDSGGLRKEVWRIDNVRNIRTLPIESREEKCAVLFDRSAERPAELIDL